MRPDSIAVADRAANYVANLDPLRQMSLARDVSISVPVSCIRIHGQWHLRVVSWQSRGNLMQEDRTDVFDAVTLDLSVDAPACEVVVAVEPPLLRNMLSRLIGRIKGIHVSAELADPAGLTFQLEHTVAHWVIVTLGPDLEMPEIVSSALAMHPSLLVLGLAADGSEVRIVCADGIVAVLSDPSLPQVIQALLGNDNQGLS